MDQIHFGLVGAGGMAREVMPFVLESLMRTTGDRNLDVKLYFVEKSVSSDLINGMEVISEDEFLSLQGTRWFNAAVNDSQIRKRVSEKMLGHADPISLYAPSSISLTENVIGIGAILCPFSAITANVKIGRFFHANIYARVAHDCVIGDFVTFAPSVQCNGNVHIHDHAYIGTGAIIKQGTPGRPLVIGEGAVVGMGAVVTKDVAPFTTVIGNPAKPIVRK